MKYSQSIAALNLFTSLKELDELVKCGLEYMHLDLVDNEYASNFGLTFNQIDFLIKRYPEIKFDVHLMVKNYKKIIEKLINSSIKCFFIPISIADFTWVDQMQNMYPDIVISFMVEAKDEIKQYQEQIKKQTKILLMTIDIIGGTGQKMNIKLLDKIQEIKNINFNILIYTDGGLRVENKKILENQAVYIAVGGSIIYNFINIEEFLKWWKE